MKRTRRKPLYLGLDSWSATGLCFVLIPLSMGTPKLNWHDPRNSTPWMSFVPRWASLARKSASFSNSHLPAPILELGIIHRE
jgi:hypothetical protein